MGRKLKSQQEPSGPLKEPTYTEFIVFGLLAVVGITAIVVFLGKRAQTPFVAQADPPVTTPAQEQESIPTPESADSADQVADNNEPDAKPDPELQQPPVVTQPETTYSLSVAGQGGAVRKRPDQASYAQGETVTLEAVPDAGFRFSGWTGDLSDSANPVTLVMDASKSVNAGFVPLAYSLMVTAQGGSVTKRPDQASYKHGATVTLEATPNPGYDFSSWTVHMAFIIIFSNIWGLIFREWKGSSKRTHKLIMLGILTLVASICVVGVGNYLQKDENKDPNPTQQLSRVIETIPSQ